VPIHRTVPPNKVHIFLVSLSFVSLIYRAPAEEFRRVGRKKALLGCKPWHLKLKVERREELGFYS
jgi:hypothetical protein